MIAVLQDKQFISSEELHEAGFSNYKIRKMVSDGTLSNVNRRWYENLNYSGEINDFYAVPVYARDGVVCLISAAVYHELSSERPAWIDVAIPRSARVPEGPDWPAMRFYRMSELRYEIGIVNIEESRNSFRVYDPEKTVCDVVYHRNKLGFESAMEVVKNYIERTDRDFNKLIDYARHLQVESTLRSYLEVLL